MLRTYSTSSSDESTFDTSTGPTSPDWSPFIAPHAHSRSFASLSRVEIEYASFDPNSLGPAALPESPQHGVITRNVCVIGAGYVGGPTAAVLALHNPHVRVTVLDRDPERIASWQSAHLPIHEPGLEAVVRLARDGGSRDSADIHTQTQSRDGNLFFSTDSAASIGNAEIIFLAVNTPTKQSGRGAGAASDLSALESATRDIAKYARNGTIIVEKSTVPCGTARLIAEILASIRPDEAFPILSNPEFLAEGSAIKNLLHPDRVLIGSAQSVVGRLAARRLASLYASWIPETAILQTNVWSSELAKLVANAMLAQRISSINSISALCERTGADVREIAKAVGTDDRIGKRFLNSGLGFGGSCFRKDISSLVYIAGSLGLPDVADYWRSVLTMNMYQRQRFTDKIVSRLNNTLNRKKVTLLGFAYKKDTGDTRESLAVDVIASLLEERPAEIAIFDPCCPKEGIERELAHLQGLKERVRIYDNVYEACQGASALAIMTEWDYFKAERTSPVLRKVEIRVASDINKSSRAEAPLSEFVPPPLQPCAEGCKQCVASGSQTSLQDGRRIDWSRVANILQEPKYLLDGRGVLDERVMKSAGLEVEGLGWGGMNNTARHCP